MPREITKTIYTYKELLALGDDAASHRARAWLIDGVNLFEWWDHEYETWGDALDQLGFEDAEISFSGFSSQGDGASFTSSLDLTKLVDFLASEIPPQNRIDRADPPLYGHDEDFRPWVVFQLGSKVTRPQYRRLLLPALEERIGERRIVRGRGCHYAHSYSCTLELDLADRGEWIPAPDHKPFHEGRWQSRTPRVRQLFTDFRDDLKQLRVGLCDAIYRSLEREYEYRTSDEQLIEDADANEWTFDVDGHREG